MGEVKLQLGVFQSLPQHIQIDLRGPGVAHVRDLPNQYELSMPQDKRLQGEWGQVVPA